MYASMLTIGERFIGIHEIPGDQDHPLIMWMLTLFNQWPEHDETAWRSAFVAAIAWMLRLQYSKSLRARSWLNVGFKIDTLEQALMANDVIILKSGPDPQPRPEIIEAPEHVGIYAGRESGKVKLLGGNQSNSISIAPYPQDDILGIRRLTAQGV